MRDEAKRNRASVLRKAEKGRMPACEMERSGIERAHCVRQEGADARVRDEAKRNRASALRKAEKGRMPACEMKRSGIE